MKYANILNICSVPSPGVIKVNIHKTEFFALQELTGNWGEIQVQCSVRRIMTEKSQGASSTENVVVSDPD